jgi:two-component system, chemotaxis family, response regulator Rcp1
MMGPVQPIQILLVEDQPADVRLTQEVLAEGKVANDLHVVGDGEQALAFIRGEGEYAERPRPDVILLDLNLPRMDGREVLAEIKRDPELRPIPVIILTTSAAERDVLESYKHAANAYITKPVDLDEFVSAVRSIEEFWLTLVRLPKHEPVH